MISSKALIFRLCAFLIIILLSVNLRAEGLNKGINLLEKTKTKQWVQVGYTTNVLGYTINNILTDYKLRVFWGGRVHVKQGVSINYQRNIIDFAKFFSFDCGINTSWWQSIKDDEHFYTISVFPALRINFLRRKHLDAYLYYAVGGPSYISKTKMDGYDLGKKFIFIDNLGLGVFFGEKRNYSVELRIGHYSNANLFMPNQGVKAPLSLNLGYGI